MSPTMPAHRRGFLAMLLTLALSAAMVTAVVDSASSAPENHGVHRHAPARAMTAAQLAFHDQMRKLWEDHVTWTRLAIVTFADGAAGFDATAARLMKNQEDIGDAIKPFYGDAAGNQLTPLLKEHIAIAVQLLQTAKAGDSAGFQAAKDAWYANADDIADFLAGANPRYWPQDTMRAAMKAHLDQTLAEASHELTGHYADSVADYEEIHHHILAMADLLSTGILRAFPSRFR